MAFNEVITQMETHTGKTCWELLGEGKNQFVAKRLKTVGGGHPTPRAVTKQWSKGKNDAKWFPGKKPDNQGGRPEQITPAQKQVMAP